MATAPTIPDSNGVTFLTNLNAALAAASSTTITTAGTAPAFTAATSAITALAAGQQVRLKFNAAGTTGSNTLNVSGLGALNLMQYNPKGVLVPAIVTSGMISDVLYDGTQWLLMDPPPLVSACPKSRYSNLVITYAQAQAYPTSVTADELVVQDTNGVQAKLLNLSLSGSTYFNLSNTPGTQGGLDTGTVTAGNIYHLYVTYNPTTGAITWNRSGACALVYLN